MTLNSARNTVLEEARRIAPTDATIEGMRLLHLEPRHENYLAGNLYVESLKLIRELIEKIESLSETIS